MKWLLDADVLSQPAKRFGDPRVVAWLEAEKDACYTSSVVIAQLAYWVRSKDGKPRDALQLWLTRLVDAMHGRIHGFNVAVAQIWAEQERLLEKAGLRMPVEDSYIAATARGLGRLGQGLLANWLAVGLECKVELEGERAIISCKPPKGRLGLSDLVLCEERGDRLQI